MSASLDRELAAAIERGAESVARRYGRRTPVTFSKGRGTVEAVNADGTLDVAYQGAVLQSVLSTTACANVAAGDSVLLEFFDARAYATGVVGIASKGAQTDYEISTVDSSITNHGSTKCKVLGGVAYYSTYMAIGSFGPWDSKTALSGFPEPADGIFVGGMATPQGSSNTPVCYYLDSSSQLILESKGGSSGVTNGWIWLSIAYPVAK